MHDDEREDAATNQEMIQAVTGVVSHRYRYLTLSSISDFDEDTLKRLKTENGYLVFTIEEVSLTEKREDAWYVAATVAFQCDTEGETERRTDIYQCSRRDGQWIVQWEASL